MFFPEPSITLPVAYRRRGIGIGDVGIITASGGFDFMFNICLPANHAINLGGVPEGFEPLSPELHSGDIHRHMDYNQNSYLASESVVKSHKENDSSYALFFCIIVIKTEIIRMQRNRVRIFCL